MMSSMAVDSCSLNTLYKQQLCSLNPMLPHLIEHLVKNAILTRTEASKIVAMSDQFNRLAQLLAEKGSQNKDAVLFEIESFRQGQKKKEEDKRESDRCHSREASVHKHSVIYNGSRMDERIGRGKTRDRKRRQKAILPRGIELVSDDTSSDSGDTQRKTSGMDPFISVFYKFLTQLLLSDDDGISHDQSCDPSHTPLIPACIKVDLTCDQVLAYFPSSFRRSIKSGGSHGHHDRHGDYDRHSKLETIPLSRLLSHFKSFVKRFDAEVRERKLLAGKVKLVESLTARNQHLEEEIWEQRKKCTGHDDLELATKTTTPVNLISTKEDTATISHLRKMLSKAESNLKELSAINGQWSLESQEKASEIKILQIQLKDALEEVQCLRVRVRQAEEMNGGVGKTRTKHSGRKETEMVQENIALKAELAELRREREKDQDEISELQDRIGNLKVQAQSKLPSVKEMTQLSSDNRQLRETVEKDRLQIKVLQKELQDLKKEHYSRHGTGSNGTKGHHHGDTGVVTNKPEILVDPLPNDRDNLTCLHDIKNSSLTTIGLKQAPLYFDATPLTPHKSTAPKDTPHLNGINIETETKNHTHIPMTSSGKPMTSSPPAGPTRITRSSPPPPNQPEATIVAGMKLTADDGRVCPVCHTTFMMLGEREFQCHVAGCHRPTS